MSNIITHTATTRNGIRRVTVGCTKYVSARDFCIALGYASASGVVLDGIKFRVASGKGSRELLFMSVDAAHNLAANKGKPILAEELLSAEIPSGYLCDESVGAPKDAEPADMLAIQQHTRPDLDMMVFSNREFGKIRTVRQSDVVWFVGRDVAKALGYANPASAVFTHCRRGREIGLLSPGGEQTTNIIPESDLYRLIMRSNLPSAERFSDWVVEEVLPTIRNHGVYATGTFLEKVLNDPDALLGTMTALVAERKARLLAESEVLLLTSDAEYGRKLSVSEGTVLVGTVAKKLTENGRRISVYSLFQWLRNEGWLTKCPGTGYNLPTQKALDAKYFEIKEHPVVHGDKGLKIDLTSYVTGAGQRYIFNAISTLFPKGPIHVDPPTPVKKPAEKAGLLSRFFGSFKQAELGL